MATIEEILQINQYVYRTGGNLPDDFSTIDTGIAGNGFYAEAIKAPTGEIVVSFRGTDGFNDLDDNVQIALLNDPKQAASATAFSSQVINKNPGIPIHVTGHSLGGNLAAHAMNRVVEDENIPTDNLTGSAINAPGIGSNETRSENFVNIISDADTVSHVGGEQYGATTVTLPVDMLYEPTQDEIDMAEGDPESTRELERESTPSLLTSMAVNSHNER